MKVPELKAELLSRGVTPSGPKPELVTLLTNSVAASGPKRMCITRELDAYSKKRLREAVPNNLLGL